MLALYCPDLTIKQHVLMTQFETVGAETIWLDFFTPAVSLILHLHHCNALHHSHRGENLNNCNLYVQMFSWIENLRRNIWVTFFRTGAAV